MDFALLPPTFFTIGERRNTDLVRTQELGYPLGLELILRLAVREGIRLGKEVAHELIVVSHRLSLQQDRALRLAVAHEICRDHAALEKKHENRGAKQENIEMKKSLDACSGINETDEKDEREKARGRNSLRQFRMSIYLSCLVYTTTGQGLL